MASSSQSNWGDDENNNMVFSSTMHKLIIIINGGAIALLQVINSQSSFSINVADRHTTLLSFCFLFLLYLLLRLLQFTLRNKPPLTQFVGNISHLFGALSALMLISIFSTIFTLIAAPIWLLWFFIVMYISFAKLLVSLPVEDDDPGATEVPLEQLSPV